MDTKPVCCFPSVFWKRCKKKSLPLSFCPLLNLILCVINNFTSSIGPKAIGRWEMSCIRLSLLYLLHLTMAFHVHCVLLSGVFRLFLLGFYLASAWTRRSEPQASAQTSQTRTHSHWRGVGWTRGYPLSVLPRESHALSKSLSYLGVDGL